MKKRLERMYFLWLLFMLLMSASMSAKTYIGTINIEVGETYNVSHGYVSDDYTTVSGNWSKTDGNAFIITSSSSSGGCTIKGNQVGTSTLNWTGVVAAGWSVSDVEYYWTVNVVEPQPLTLSANPSGGEVKKGTTVKLYCKGKGAEWTYDQIYYTLDGSNPTVVNGKRYTSIGIVIDEDCTLRAIGQKWNGNSYDYSDELVETYTIKIEKLTLSASPYSKTGNTIDAGTTVYLTTPNVSGADIYYTLNGTEPTEQSIRYTSSGITINESCILKAIAYKEGYETSDVLKRRFAINQNISINETNFPDENFRNELLSRTYGQDGIIDGNEILNQCIQLSPSNRNIQSLKGIEFFALLQDLGCTVNKLTSLDLSKNIYLESLQCSHNQITSIDVSKNILLYSLNCTNNKLISLDVSKNTALTYLNCSSNQLTSLDVSKNTALTELYCYLNQINGKAMDDLISSLPYNSSGITYGFYVLSTSDNEGNVCTKSQVAAAKAKGWTPLYWDGSSYKEYEGSEDPNSIYINSTNFPDDNFRNWLLESYYGKDGKLTEDEIKEVTSIDVHKKNISTLKGIEYFTNLDRLYCYSNQLTSLDVSKNTALTILNCTENQLTTLDVSNNTKLENFLCYSNQLTTLDVSKNMVLKWLYCQSNQLTSLDVSKNTALKWLYCQSNQLTSLDVSKNTALDYLLCSSNQLTSLDVSKNTILTLLDCHQNQINETAMDNLISSLPYNSSDKTYEFYVISPSYDDEGNVCTKNQVAAIKAKGWTAYCLVGHDWQEYEGSDEYQYAKGDVNMDNAVNGTDLVALSNIVLGRKEKTETADVNGDGSVNGTDIVALSNIILGRSNKASRRTSASGASLSIEDFDIKAGETKEMLIDLSNPNDEVTLVQFDLHLPAGLSIKKSGSDLDFDMAGRTSWRKHTLDANEINGAYRFLLYSSGNTLIEGTSGAIIKVNIVADESFNGGKIVLDNILLVDPNEKETKPEAYEYVIPTPDDGSAKLSIEPFDIAVGETKEMLIDLSNPNDEVTLVQFDLHLPAGLSIKKSGSDLDFDMAGRTSWRKHTLDANEVDGAYRFLLYSSGNTLIESTSGAIIKVNLVADESFNGGKIVLDNILLVDPNEKETKPANYEYVIGSGSGISTVMIDASGENTRIYNLSGQKLTAPKKGVNIINGKKIVIR